MDLINTGLGVEPEGAEWDVGEGWCQWQLLPIFKKFYLFILERGEGREKEKGDKHWCERNIHQLPLATCPQPETRPATQARAPMGNQTWEPSICGTVPNQLSCAARRFCLFSHCAECQLWLEQFIWCTNEQVCSD